MDHELKLLCAEVMLTDKEKVLLCDGGVLTMAHLRVCAEQDLVDFGVRHGPARLLLEKATSPNIRRVKRHWEEDKEDNREHLRARVEGPWPHNVPESVVELETGAQPLQQIEWPCPDHVSDPLIKSSSRASVPTWSGRDVLQ